MTNTIAFNTGRTYTEFGQRIAARKLDNGIVAMLDIDRGINYLLPASVELTQRDVMRAYDNNDEVFVSESGMDYEEYFSIIDTLRSVAQNVAGV